VIPFVLLVLAYRFDVDEDSVVENEVPEGRVWANRDAAKQVAASREIETVIMNWRMIFYLSRTTINLDQN